jgi:hypothetical protein
VRRVAEYETDLISLDTVRKAKRAIEVIMPRELVCPLKEHTPTLNAVLFREVEVVFARLAVAVCVICRFPLRQRLDNPRV